MAKDLVPIIQPYLNVVKYWITAEDFSHKEAEAFVNIYGLSKIPMNDLMIYLSYLKYKHFRTDKLTPAIICTGIEICAGNLQQFL